MADRPQGCVTPEDLRFFIPVAGNCHPTGRGPSCSRSTQKSENTFTQEQEVCLETAEIDCQQHLNVCIANCLDEFNARTHDELVSYYQTVLAAAEKARKLDEEYERCRKTKIEGDPTYTRWLESQAFQRRTGAFMGNQTKSYHKNATLIEDNLGWWAPFDCAQYDMPGNYTPICRWATDIGDAAIPRGQGPTPNPDGSRKPFQKRIMETLGSPEHFLERDYAQSAADFYTIMEQFEARCTKERGPVVKPWEGPLIGPVYTCVSACHQAAVNICQIDHCFCWSTSCDPDGNNEEPPQEKERDPFKDGTVRITDSAYDIPIELVYTRAFMPGNIIYISPVTTRARLVEVRSPFGGIRSKAVATNYISMSLGLCAGPIEGVTRIWVDNILAYSTVGGDTSDVYAGQPNLEFIVATGTEDALPVILHPSQDPETTPGYRGLAVLHIKDLDITAFDAFPKFKVEVVRSSASPDGFVTEIIDVIPDPWQYKLDENILLAGNTVYTGDTVEEIISYNSDGIFNTAISGRAYFRDGRDINYETPLGSLGPVYTHDEDVDYVDVFTMNTKYGIEEWLLIHDTEEQYWLVPGLDISRRLLVDGTYTDVPTHSMYYFWSRPSDTIQGATTEGESLLVLTPQGADLNIKEFVTLTNSLNILTADTTAFREYTLSNLFYGVSSVEVKGHIFLQAEHDVMFFLRFDDSFDAVVRWSVTAGVYYAVALDYTLVDQIVGTNTIQNPNPRVLTLDGDVIEIDINTGAAFTHSTAPTLPNTAQFFNGRRNRLVYVDADDNLAVAGFAGTENFIPETLYDAVRDVAQRSGLIGAKVDILSLSDYTITGFRSGSKLTGAEILSELFEVYQAIPFTADFFFGASRLNPVGGDIVIPEMASMLRYAVSLPDKNPIRGFELEYYSDNLLGEKNQQKYILTGGDIVKRVYTVLETDLYMAGLAEILTTLEADYKSALDAKLPQEFSILLQGDLLLYGGKLFKIVDIAIGADSTVDVKASLVPEEEMAILMNLIAYSPPNITPDTLPTFVPFVEVTTTRAVEPTGQRNLLETFAAMVGESSEELILARVPDPITIYPGAEQIDVSTEGLWGELVDALGPTTAYNSRDMDTVLQVDFGTPEKAARAMAAIPFDAPVIAGTDDPRLSEYNRNLLLVGYEIIQFRFASLSGSVISFTNLYRARGRTDYAMDHDAGEKCLLVTPEVLRYTQLRGNVYLAGRVGLFASGLYRVVSSPLHANIDKASYPYVARQDLDDGSVRIHISPNLPEELNIANDVTFFPPPPIQSYDVYILNDVFDFERFTNHVNSDADTYIIYRTSYQSFAPYNEEEAYPGIVWESSDQGDWDDSQPLYLVVVDNTNLANDTTTTFAWSWPKGTYPQRTRGINAFF